MLELAVGFEAADVCNAPDQAANWMTGITGMDVKPSEADPSKGKKNLLENSGA